eukprot:s5089_g3.t4
MSEADGASPFSEETSGAPRVEEPSTEPQATKAKTKVKKVRNTTRSAKADAPAADVEEKGHRTAAGVTADAAPAEAPEAAAPAKEAATAKGKAKGSAEAGKSLPATVTRTAAAPADEQKEVAEEDRDETEQRREEKKEDGLAKEAARLGDLNKVAAAGPEETEHPREDASTSAGSDKEKTKEESLVGAARCGDLNKASPPLAVSLLRFGVPDETEQQSEDETTEESLVEAARCGDLNKVKELLANDCDPDALSNALEDGKQTFARRTLAADGRSRGFLPRARAAVGKSSGTRPLITAAASGHSHVAWELLRSRADMDARDSDGLTALSAAFCSPDCDIHMWFLLHHAADQKRKKPDQRSDAQEVIRNDDDERTCHMLPNTQADTRADQKRNQRSDFQEDIRNDDERTGTLLREEQKCTKPDQSPEIHDLQDEEKRTLHMLSNAHADFREEEFLRTLLGGNMNAQLMADIRADEKRTLRMLVTLLRGEGQIFTEMVAGLLKEVEPGCYRSERLKERMRTVLCDYAWDRQQVQNFLDRGRPDLRKSIFTDDRAKKPEEVDGFNLSWHNMLYAPEVQVSLRSLPIAAPLACKPSVLAALAETANEETLQTDAVEAITAAAWLQLRVATGVDNFLNCVALGCLCLVTWACRKQDMDAQPALWVLAMIQIKEGVELLSKGCLVHVDRVNGKDLKLLGDADISFVHPAPSLETLVDLFFLVAGSFAIYRQMDICSVGELEPIFLPGFCSMYWLRLMYSLHTGAFFFVTSLCVASATHAYVIMNPRGDDVYPIYSSFLHTVRLAIFGDFDLFEYQGQDTKFKLVNDAWEPDDPSPKAVGEDPASPYRPYIYLQLCFFGTGIGITVLLMNLLIAILSQNYEMQQDRAQGLFVQARARMLLEVQRRPWMMMARWLGRKLLAPDDNKPPSPDGYLAKLAKIALSPLKIVMEPFVPGAYYQTIVFERLIQRALWSPVAKYKFLALGIPVVSVVLLAGSLMSLLAFMVIALVLTAVRFRLTGIRYTLNLSLFGLFGDRFADECEIFALVRTETGLDDLRSMRSDLKDKMQNLEGKLQNLEGKLQKQHEEQKARMHNVDDKIDRVLQHLSLASADAARGAK